MTRSEMTRHALANYRDKTLKTLAAETGFSTGVIWGVLRRNGRSTRNHPRELIETVCAERWATTSYALAERYGLTPVAISSIWDRHRALLPPRPIPPKTITAPRISFSETLGIRAVEGPHGISLPRVSILHGQSPPQGG